MDHLQHFGLNLDPFQIEPDLRFYYDSAGHKDAQRRVERGLRQCKGLSLLTGEGGTGKSLLARRLLGDLEEEIFEAALMVMLPGAADANSVVGRFARHLEIEDVADPITLKVNEYSDWVELTFKAGMGIKVQGIAKFYLIDTEPEVNLYMTPIHIDPENPAMPISPKTPIAHSQPSIRR